MFFVLDVLGISSLKSVLSLHVFGILAWYTVQACLLVLSSRLESVSLGYNRNQILALSVRSGWGSVSQRVSQRPFSLHGFRHQAMVEEITSTEMPEDRSELAVVASVGSPKRVGRSRKGRRPKIDIDDEIDEANQVAKVTKKMMKAAKASQRESHRRKHRLVRKAAKLGSVDLERIAKLKRCGASVFDSTEPSTSSMSSAASSSSSSSEPISSSVRSVNSKVLSAVGQSQGAVDLFASTQQHVSGGTPMSTSGPGVASSGAEPVTLSHRVLDGHGPTFRTASAAAAVTSPASPSAETVPGSPHFEELQHAEDEDGNVAM